MKKLGSTICVLLLAALALNGCAGQALSMQPFSPSDTSTDTSRSPAGVEDELSQQADPSTASSEGVLEKSTTSATPTSVAKMGPESCPVTQPPDPAFVPPAPYRPQPLGDRFWYGTEALWTTVPVDGRWQQLLYGEKVFWWRKGYVWNEELRPALTVTGRRLDGPAPPAEASRATNAFAQDIGSAMLVGMELPAAGCWEITGQYGDDTLSFVVWVPP